MIPTWSTNIRGYGANAAVPAPTTRRSPRPNQFIARDTTWLTAITSDSSSTWSIPPSSPTSTAMITAKNPWTSVKTP